jgi:hypothetical protein
LSADTPSAGADIVSMRGSSGGRTSTSATAPVPAPTGTSGGGSSSGRRKLDDAAAFKGVGSSGREPADEGKMGKKIKAPPATAPMPAPKGP